MKLGAALGWGLAALALGQAATAVVNALVWPRLRPARAETSPGALAGDVSVLIPARDEESNLPGCLAAALAEPADPADPADPAAPAASAVAEVLVYDDRSTDGTARVVEDAAARDPRVRLVSGGPLPAGWCGKPHALARLADEARGEWLLFLDADARLRPGAPAALVAEAVRRDVDLLAPWPGLVLVSPAEKLLMPLLHFVVLTLYPTWFQTLRDDPALGLAHGATILLEAESYRRMGGHGAVRDEIFEDTALARAARQAGLSTVCLDGQGLVRVRMYGSFGEIWAGFRKNFFPGFRRAPSFWAFLALRAGTGLLPFVVFPLAAAGAVATDPRPWGLACLGTWTARGALALRFGQPLWSALAHPLAEGVLVALGWSSWRAVASGRGVSWKGRTYLGGNPPGGEGA